MSNKLFVQQSHGLGDCIFAQTLVRMTADPKDIIWPVKNWMLDGLRVAYPDIVWVREDLHLITEQQKKDILRATIVPINRAYELNSGKKEDWMKEKYALYGIDWRRWREKAGWRVDAQKNNELLSMFDGEFNLINDTFRNDKTGRIPISINNGAININMSDPLYERFNLFDWTFAMKQAQSIHFVNSAMLYMLELLDTTEDLTIYDRWPDEHKFPYTKYLFTKPYKEIIHPI